VKICKLNDFEGCTHNRTVYLWEHRKLVTAVVTATHTIVIEVTAGIENMGHNFFVDNFFSS
jgi:hypothetical protein